MNRWQQIALACALGSSLVLSLPPVAAARTKASAQASRHKLDRIHKEIGQLRHSVTQNRRSHAQIQAELQKLETEIEIQDARLKQSQAEQLRLQSRLRQLKGQSLTLSQQLREQRELLRGQLRAAYMQSPQSLLQLWLEQKNPAEPRRGMEFFRRLNTARLKQIARIQHTSQAVADKSTELAHTQHRLQQVARQIAAQQQALQERHQTRQQLALELQQTITGQEKRLTQLQQDAKRLDNLLQRLAAQAARRAKLEAARRARARAREEAARRHARQKESHHGKTEHQKKEASAMPDVTFAQLPPPVRGPIVVHFGTPRQNGGLRWQGITFRSSVGSPVRAIAAGTVVYAGTLRGYGQIMILDHGNGLLSLYGHIQGMLRSVNQHVAAGEQLASVGQDPDQEESGLYFELRKNGRPVDPLHYLRLR